MSEEFSWLSSSSLMMRAFTDAAQFPDQLLLIELILHIWVNNTSLQFAATPSVSIEIFSPSGDSWRKFLLASRKAGNRYLRAKNWEKTWIIWHEAARGRPGERESEARAKCREWEMFVNKMRRKCERFEKKKLREPPTWKCRMGSAISRHFHVFQRNIFEPYGKLIEGDGHRCVAKYIIKKVGVD